MTNAKNNKHSNALTIDVEDGWSIFARDWLAKNMEPTDTVVRDTQWILETLEQKSAKATFFILGDVAKTFPNLIKQIAQHNHEIGVHGFSHKQIFKLTKEEFRNEISYTKKLLEDICFIRLGNVFATSPSIKNVTFTFFCSRASRIHCVSLTTVSVGSISLAKRSLEKMLQPSSTSILRMFAI